MFSKILRIMALLLLSCFALPNTTYAADVAAAYSIDASVSDGESVQGTMTVTVFNLSGDDLINVDLRLDLGELNSVSDRVLQFGLVSAGEGGVIPVAFQFEQEKFDEIDALPWRLDYDDLAGTHTSIRIVTPRTR